MSHCAGPRPHLTSLLAHGARGAAALACVWAAAAAAPAERPADVGGAGYPATRKEPVTQDFHGNAVVDEYRWLESLERDSAEVAAWTTAQNERTRSALGSHSVCNVRPGRDISPGLTGTSAITPA